MYVFLSSCIALLEGLSLRCFISQNVYNLSFQIIDLISFCYWSKASTFLRNYFWKVLLTGEWKLFSYALLGTVNIISHRIIYNIHTYQSLLVLSSLESSIVNGQKDIISFWLDGKLVRIMFTKIFIISEKNSFSYRHTDGRTNRH